MQEVTVAKYFFQSGKQFAVHQLFNVHHARSVAVEYPRGRIRFLGGVNVRQPELLPAAVHAGVEDRARNRLPRRSVPHIRLHQHRDDRDRHRC